MPAPRAIAQLLAAAMLAHLAMPIANAAEQAIPVNLAVSSTSFAPASSECLMTTGAAAAAAVEGIRRFRAALDAVATLIKQKPDEAKRALGSAYPQLEPAALDLAFSQQADNWTHPQFSEADVRQQIRLL